MRELEKPSTAHQRGAHVRPYRDAYRFHFQCGGVPCLRADLISSIGLSHGGYPLAVMQGSVTKVVWNWPLAKWDFASLLSDYF